MRVVRSWFWESVKPDENVVQTITRVLGNLMRSTLTISVLGCVFYFIISPERGRNALVSLGISKSDEEMITVQVSLVKQDKLYQRLRPIWESLIEKQANCEPDPLFGCPLGAFETVHYTEILNLIKDPETAYLGCTPEYPVVLFVQNRSKKTLLAMQIDLEARRPGFSKNELSYGARRIQWDTIVPAGRAYSVCVQNFEVTSQHSLSALPSAQSIKLVKTEQWMLEESRAWQITTNK